MLGSESGLESNANPKCGVFLSGKHWGLELTIFGHFSRLHNLTVDIFGTKHNMENR